MTAKKIALLIAYLLSFATFALGSNPCGEFSNDWSKCGSNDECVLDETACYSVAAYHKEHLETVRRYNHCFRPMIKCAPPPADDKLKTLAVCREKKCVAINPEDKSSKMNFEGE